MGSNGCIVTSPNSPRNSSDFCRYDSSNLADMSWCFLWLRLSDVVYYLLVYLLTALLKGL